MKEIKLNKVIKNDFISSEVGISTSSEVGITNFSVLTLKRIILHNFKREGLVLWMLLFCSIFIFSLYQEVQACSSDQVAKCLVYKPFTGDCAIEACVPNLDLSIGLKRAGEEAVKVLDGVGNKIIIPVMNTALTPIKQGLDEISGVNQMQREADERNKQQRLRLLASKDEFFKRKEKIIAEKSLFEGKIQTLENINNSLKFDLDLDPSEEVLANIEKIVSFIISQNGEQQKIKLFVITLSKEIAIKTQQNRDEISWVKTMILISDQMETDSLPEQQKNFVEQLKQLLQLLLTEKDSQRLKVIHCELNTLSVQNFLGNTLPGNQEQSSVNDITNILVYMKHWYGIAKERKRTLIHMNEHELEKYKVELSHKNKKLELENQGLEEINKELERLGHGK